MRISCLATMITMATSALAGCSSDTTTPPGGSSGGGSLGAAGSPLGGSSGAPAAGTSSGGAQGGGSSGAPAGGTSSSGNSSGGANVEAFELDGSWIYLGPSDAPHDLKISNGTMSFIDVAGAWASNWTVKSHDDTLNHFQLAFVSGSGSYLPVGESLSATYDVAGTLLTMQLAQGVDSYPPLQGAGTCTSATDGTPLPDCKLYIKQN